MADAPSVAIAMNKNDEACLDVLQPDEPKTRSPPPRMLGVQTVALCLLAWHTLVANLELEVKRLDLVLLSYLCAIMSWSYR